MSFWSEFSICWPCGDVFICWSRFYTGMYSGPVVLYFTIWSILLSQLHGTFSSARTHTHLDLILHKNQGQCNCWGILDLSWIIIWEVDCQQLEYSCLLMNTIGTISLNTVYTMEACMWVFLKHWAVQSVLHFWQSKWNSGHFTRYVGRRRSKKMHCTC